LESKKELEDKKTKIDIEQLRMIYSQSELYIKDLQKTFEDLCIYHDKMLNEKTKFITNELPLLNKEINIKELELKELLIIEKNLFQKIESSDSFEKLEEIIFELNLKFQKK
jgi:hypothetical protein